jgi:Big-like domain-containing protein/alpha-2-macroglobulin family protein
LVAALGVLVIAVGSGVGVYLDSRAHPPLRQVAKRVVAAPTAAPVGTTTVSQTQQAVLLTVISTTPADGTSGIATNTSISLVFNLAVNPAAVRSLAAVRVSDTSVPGQFVQGKRPQEVVFKPASQFEYAESVALVLRSGLKSVDGAVLGNDYSLSFTTVASPTSVTFFDSNRQARLVSEVSGHPVTLRIETGDDVPADVTIKTYKATAKDLLASLVYTTSDCCGPSYLRSSIDIRSMRLVDNGGTTLSASGARWTKPIVTGVDVTIVQPDGIYLILAVNSRGQYGAAWVEFSRYGILLRQDDQKIVVAGQDLISGDATRTFDLTFYNLLGGVHSKLAGSFSGVGEFAVKYSTAVDIAIATSGGEEIAVPISAPDSGADIRVGSDLSQQPQIFITTDRPAYQKGETVRFAGVVRRSNDQVYSAAGGMKLTLWARGRDWTMGEPNVGTAVTAPDGTFSGSFTIPAAFFGTDGLDGWVTLSVNGTSFFNGLNANGISGSTSFLAVAPNSASNTLAVSLSKSVYVKGEPIVASITGTDAQKHPLAGKTVKVSVWASQHQSQPAELDNFAWPSSWGERLSASVNVALDASGHATYRMPEQLGLKAIDQEISIVAVYGSGRTQAYAAGTAIVYQADYNVFFLPARPSIHMGDTAVAPFVVEGHDGARIGGLQLAYQLETTDYSGDSATTTVVTSGTATTDAHGIGWVRSAYSGSPASLVVDLKGKDGAGRVFEAAQSLNVLPVGDPGPRLDIAADKIAYVIGDTVNLTVTSPFAVQALLSLERGRIHQYRWVNLTKGANAIPVNVTPELAPGFSVVLSYIHSDEYSSEDLPVAINNSNRLLKLTVTPNQETYTKGQVAHVSISVADSTGAPVAATLLANGYENRISSNLLVDHASIAGAFLVPNRLGTNASSSLANIGVRGDGICGIDGEVGTDAVVSGTYPGRTNLWLTDVTTDASGRASIDVPMNLSGPVRLVLIASTPTSSWGQIETVLSQA